MPAAHLPQVFESDAPVAREADPAAQPVQLADATAAEKNPTGQLEHALADRPEYKPAGHTAQPAEAALAWYKPAVQSLQFAAAGSANLPAEQLVQKD